MGKKSPYLNVYLGPLKEPWAAYCKARGLKPGAALKEAIEKQLAQATTERPAAKAAATYKQAGEDEPIGPKGRFEILLTHSEKEAIRERARIEQCSMRRWIVDAIRAGLTGEPQFRTAEIEALGESNYQLLAIGRNLNQVARRLNEGRGEKVTVDAIKKLDARIRRHVKAVSHAMRASLERWNLK